MPLTVEEKTVIKLYSGFSPNRDRTLQSIRASLPLVEEKEIANLMDSVIRKVNAMTDKDFDSIDLSDTVDSIEP